GIMEIADIFVVNKADRENADKAVMDLQAMLQLDNKEKAWTPPIIKTVALTGEGVPQLIEKIEEHWQYLQKGPLHKRSLEKAEAELVEAIKDKVTSSIIEKLKREKRFEEILRRIVEREIDPASAAEKLLNQMLE
ncbi:MAG: methylmalonyl Co-A mutase-associated GTPase MeaB, partial [Candidatus Bathyarchaeia archaeon]